jgi:hypothetical protein
MACRLHGRWCKWCAATPSAAHASGVPTALVLQRNIKRMLRRSNCPRKAGRLGGKIAWRARAENALAQILPGEDLCSHIIKRFPNTHPQSHFDL